MLENLDKTVGRILRIIMIISTSLVFLVTFIQVVSRFLFHMPIPWSSDMLRISFVWAVFCGAAVCAKNNEHIRMDMALNYISAKGRLMVEAAIFTVLAVFCAILTCFAVIYALAGLNQRAPYLPIPMTVMFMALPLCTGLMTAYYIPHVVITLKKLHAKGGEQIQC